MRACSILLVVLLFVIHTSTLQAQFLVDTSSAQRQAGDDESIAQAIEITRQMAIRSSMEKILGVHMKSQTTIENFKLVSDELVSQTMGHAQVELLNDPRKSYFDNQGLVTVIVQVSFDTTAFDFDTQGKDISVLATRMEALKYLNSHRDTYSADSINVSLTTIINGFPEGWRAGLLLVFKDCGSGFVCEHLPVVESDAGYLIAEYHSRGVEIADLSYRDIYMGDCSPAVQSLRDPFVIWRSSELWHNADSALWDGTDFWIDQDGLKKYAEQLEALPAN